MAVIIINNKDILRSSFSPNLGVIHLPSPSPPASSSPWQDLPTTPSFLPLHSCLWQFPLPGPPLPSALPIHVFTSTRGHLLQDVLPDQLSSLITQLSLSLKSVSFPKWVPPVTGFGFFPCRLSHSLAADGKCHPDRPGLEPGPGYCRGPTLALKPVLIPPQMSHLCTVQALPPLPLPAAACGPARGAASCPQDRLGQCGLAPICHP